MSKTDKINLTKMTERQYFWYEHVCRQMKEGGSIKEYAERHDLNPNSLYDCRRQLRKRGLLPAKQKVSHGRFKRIFVQQAETAPVLESEESEQPSEACMVGPQAEPANVPIQKDGLPKPALTANSEHSFSTDHSPRTISSTDQQKIKSAQQQDGPSTSDPPPLIALVQLPNGIRLDIRGLQSGSGMADLLRQAALLPC